MIGRRSATCSRGLSGHRCSAAVLAPVVCSRGFGMRSAPIGLTAHQPDTSRRISQRHAPSAVAVDAQNETAAAGGGGAADKAEEPAPDAPAATVIKVGSAAATMTILRALEQVRIVG